MKRNDKKKDENILQICQALKKTETPEQIYDFLTEIFAKTELDALSKRWRILKMLNDGITQRQIAHDIHVSLCNVTKGAAILKDENAMVKKFLIKENKNEQQKNEGGWTRLFRQIRR